MARRARLVNPGEPTVYHIVSRTTLPGYPIGDVEKDYFFKLLNTYGKRFFVDILGACAMGNHVHLVLRVHPGDRFSDEEIRRRYKAAYGDDREELSKDRVQFYREKWASLSQFMKELKQSFTRFYNKRKNKRGYFWGDRFKSIMVEQGETLINCLAYVDLNPVRAGLVDTPEQYRWNTLGYLVQTENRDDLFSLDFGLTGQENYSKEEILKHYRRFVYGIGVKPTKKGRSIPEKKFRRQKKRGYEMRRVDRFACRTRYFTDSVIIGSREFVADTYKRFQVLFKHKHEKSPELVSGLSGVYSLRKFV